MDIQRFKQDHIKILNQIEQLRLFAKAGIATHATDIAQGLEDLSNTVVHHLAVEDRILYPSLEKGTDPELAALSKKYQQEMTGVSNPFIRFVRKWTQEGALVNNPEGFRSEANVVLKNVHARISQENREFYPAVERVYTD